MNATGYLTTNGSWNSSNGPTKLDSGTADLSSSLTVYGYISQLNGTNDGGSAGQKNCGNPVYRYTGLAWLTNSSTATLDWGALTANGNSAACYPIWGTNDYLHANSTTTCVWSAGSNPGINYKVLGITLSPTNIRYQRNSSGLTNQGDFEFVFNSCSTFYQDASGTGEVLKTGVAKSNLGTLNKQSTLGPGANCGNLLTQDDTGTTESFVDDASDPTMNYVQNNAGTNSWASSNQDTTIWINGTVSGSVSLTGNGSDSGASVNSGVKDYTYQAMAGTTTGWSPTSAAELAGARTYSWTNAVGDGQTATVPVIVNDKAGRTSGAITITLKGDDTPPTIAFSSPPAGPTYQTTASATVAWTESEAGSGIATRSLQRFVSTGGVNGTYAPDGSPYTGTSSSSQTLAEGSCYYWVQTTTDHVGLAAPVTSGKVCVDSLPPTATFTSPLPNQVEHGVVDVVGSATDLATFRDWTVDYGVGASPTSWTTVATGTNQVAGAFIADWDTRALSGLNTVRLTVRDWAGHTTQTTSTVFLENTERGAEPYRPEVPFDLGGGWQLSVAADTGEARLSRQLFNIPSFGPSQSLTLTYSSLLSDGNGQFGVGWMSNLTQYLTFENGFIVWHRADGAREPFGQVNGVWTPLSGHFEALTAGSEDVVTLQDQTRLVFESSGGGRLKRIENRFGRALTMAWNSNSATATDASGRATNIVINSAKGRITDVTDSAGRHWTFGYANGNSNTLISITDPAGKVTNLAYDANNELTTVTRARTPASGPAETIVWSVAYTAGKATSVTDPINTSVSDTFTYNAGNTVVGLLKTYSPSTRNTWTFAFSYGGPGWQLAKTDPASFVTTSTYDAQWRLTSVSRPVGLTSTYQLVSYTYDRGNVATETDQLDATRSVQTVNSYSAANDLLTQSEADNDSTIKTVTLFTYDGAGHLISKDVNCTSSGLTPPTPSSSCTGAGTQDAATNLVTTYSYTSTDQLQDESDPLGHDTRHTYDTFGNETAVIQDYQASGSGPDVNVTTSTAFDQGMSAGQAGLPTSATDPNGNVTTFTYDSLGRRTSTVLPGDTTIPGLTRTTTYDELGNVLTETDAWTGSSRVTTHVYDKANRETSVTDGAGTTTTTGFDAAGDPTSSTTAGVTKSMTFDGLGRVLSETVGSSVTQHTYDAAGDELETVDPSGVTTDRTFDLAGDVLTESNASGVETTQYDLLARPHQNTDAAGAVTTYVYDGAGRTVQTIVDGAQTWNAYDRAGNLLSVLNPTGQVTGTIVDGVNRPIVSIGDCTNTGTTVPAGGVVCTGSGTRDATTNIMAFTYYDPAGNVVGTKDANFVITKNIVNVRNLADETIIDCTNVGHAPVTDAPSCSGSGTADGQTNVDTTTTYDGSGSAVAQTVTVTGVGGITTASAYDGAGKVTATKDAMGTVTRSFYDANGQLASVVVNCTNTGTTVPTTGWESCAGTGTHDGTYNLTTSFTYDNRGNKISQIEPNGRVTQYVYDAANRIIQQTQNYTAGTPAADQNLSTYYAFDSSGRQVAVRTPTTDRSTFMVTGYRYDAAGRVIAEDDNCTISGTTPPGDPAWKACNDLSGGTRDGQTNIVTLYTYDARGNRLTVEAPDPSANASSTATVLTAFAYDQANRLCRVLEHATSATALTSLANPCTDTVSGGTSTTNVSTKYAYDGAGHLASMVDGSGHATSYTYDGNGHLTGLTDALGHTLVWQYDALGRQSAQLNRDGTTVTFTYDEVGRLVGRAATGAASSAYTYDANGNRLTASDGTETITTTFDRLNRPITVSINNDSSGGTTYSYALNSTSWTDPTGSYLATLDAFGRETGLTDPINGASSWTSTYRADGQPASQAAPNGNTTSWTYDTVDRATGSSTTAAGPTTRASYSYSLNRAGERLSEASNVTGDPTNGTTSLSYDALGRLIGYSGAAVTTQAYSWAAVPNRVTMQIGSNPVVTTTFNAANRPTTDSNGGTYSTDLDGRLTARPGQVLVWDALGRLVQVKDSSNNNISTYTYDPLDRLASVVRPSGTLKFRYVGTTSNIAQARDASGTVQYNVAHGLAGDALFDFGPGGTNVRYYGTNGHGDLTWTATSTGSVSATLRSDPWGVPGTATGGPLPDFRFQGAWYDTASALTWDVARWYAPGLGQFISEDSVLGNPQQPESRDLYAYGMGEPVGTADPDGHYWYVIRSGDTLANIASRLMGTSARWPMVYNANRSNTAAVKSVNYIYAGKCLWIPRDWISSTGIPASDPACGNRVRPLSAVLAQDVHEGGFVPYPNPWYIEQAATRLYIWGGFRNMAPSQLVSLTTYWTGRGTDISYGDVKPSVEDWFNPLARSVIRGNGGFTLPYYPSGFSGGWALPDIRLVYGNTLWPVQLHAIAYTMGYYIFIDGKTIGYPPPRWLISHEYVHVLQYEGLGLDITGYLFYGTNGPSNPYEAIAYLWQGYTYAYNRASWEVFWPPAP